MSRRVVSWAGVIGIIIAAALACHDGLDAPEITISSPQFATTISGPISGCTQSHGSPASGCVQLVRAVAAGAACGAAAIAEAGLSGSEGGSWMLQGLSAGTTYNVYGINQGSSGTACSAPSNVTTNARPLASQLFGIETPNNRTITGSITPCEDDGAPHASCTQAVLAVDSDASCNIDCSCDGPIRGSAPANSGFRAIVDANGENIEPEREYRLYAKTDDGEFSTCSNGSQFVTTPLTIDGCEKYAANTFAVSPDTTSIRGARATWQVEDAFATDWQFGGFSQSAILIAVNQKPLLLSDGKGNKQAESIEVGVTRGLGDADVLAYFTAWNHLPSGHFIDRLIPGSPSVGQTVGGRIRNCGLNPPESGCKQPWSSTNSPFEYAACIGGGCFHWDRQNLGSLAPGPGTPDFWIGFEATCNTYPGNLSPPSRMNTTTMRNMQYRWLGFWQNLHNLNPRPTLGKFPAPSSVHGTDCCNGLVPGTTDQCMQPLDFLFFFNSSTPQTCATF